MICCTSPVTARIIGLVPVVDFLDHHNGTFIVILTTALVVVNMAYVWVTQGLLREARAQRKQELAPSVVVYTTPNDRSPTLLDIVVTNTGRGTAHDLQFSTNVDREALRKARAYMPELLVSGRLAYLAPTVELRSLVGAVNEMLAQRLPDFTVSVTYLSGRHRVQHDFPITISSYAGFVWAGAAPAEVEAANALKDIAGQLKGVVRLEGVPVITQTRAGYERRARRMIRSVVRLDRAEMLKRPWGLLVRFGLPSELVPDWAERDG